MAHLGYQQMVDIENFSDKIADLSEFCLEKYVESPEDFSIGLLMMKKKKWPRLVLIGPKDGNKQRTIGKKEKKNKTTTRCQVKLNTAPFRRSTI